MAKSLALKALGFVNGDDFWRGIASIAVFLIFWEVGSRSQALFGFAFPWVSQIPAPSAVLQDLIVLVQDPSFWMSALLSTLRVFEGFLAAMAIGIPLGLAMAVSCTFYGITFPVFEVLRPIPPLAWVPASIIFWPTSGIIDRIRHVLGCVLHNRYQCHRWCTGD